jgi:hypothetical protein
MAEINFEHEKLIEQLTLDVNMEPALMVPYWDGVEYIFINGWHTHDGKLDRVYRNKEGKLHRLYGPAYLNRTYNVEMWFKDGVLHRGDGGPAITHNQNKYWYFEGKYHRLDGSAIVTGGTPPRYYIHGQKLSPKEYKKEIARRKRKGHYGFKTYTSEGN